MALITEMIKKRCSCRTYSDVQPDEKIIQEFTTLLEVPQTGPFGNQPKFNLISPDQSAGAQVQKYGTYGVIQNARLFLVGSIKDGMMAMEDYGYCKENFILRATALGLATCWLGGTFKVGEFARAVDLQEDELLPTISPVGLAADQKSMTEKIMRRFAGSDERKAWTEIFFTGNFATPLNEQYAGPYAEALENLRLAPSASNKQPWRILYDNNRNIFHFYLSRAFGYNLLRGVSLQNIDMGIAMSHFTLTAQELGLKGQWEIGISAPRDNALDYIASWLAEN